MRDLELRERVREALRVGGSEDLKAEVMAVLDHLAECGDATHVELVLARLREGHSPYEVLGTFHLRVGRRRIPLQVAPGVMPPGSDTQIVADGIRALLRHWRRQRFDAVVDVGCGSGVLGIAALAGERGARGVFIDVSRLACRAAVQNVLNAGLAGRSLVVQGSGLGCVALGTRYALVVANLPFVPTHQLGCLPRRFGVHAPQHAVDGGADGLAIIRSFVNEAEGVLLAGSVVLLQHARDQTGKVRELLGSSWNMQYSKGDVPYTIASMN